MPRQTLTRNPRRIKLLTNALAALVKYLDACPAGQNMMRQIAGEIRQELRSLLSEEKRGWLDEK